MGCRELYHIFLEKPPTPWGVEWWWMHVFEETTEMVERRTRNSTVAQWSKLTTEVTFLFPVARVKNLIIQGALIRVQRRTFPH
jgi:hypothetical protein